MSCMGVFFSSGELDETRTEVVEIFENPPVGMFGGGATPRRNGPVQESSGLRLRSDGLLDLVPLCSCWITFFPRERKGWLLALSGVQAVGVVLDERPRRLLGITPEHLCLS